MPYSQYNKNNNSQQQNEMFSNSPSLSAVNEEHTMESNLFDYEALRKQPENFFIKRYQQGSVYKGQLLNGKRHGLGVMIYRDNIRVYEG